MFNTGRVALCAALLAGAVWISGCAGEEDGYRTSPAKLLTIYLNVATPDGLPLEGATVWVDGSAIAHRTEGVYRRLDSSFPPDWRGWEYNWSGGPYRFDTRDCYRDRCTIEIMVSKTGWQTRRTTITFGQGDPDDLFMRQTFVMQHQVNPAAAAEVVDLNEAPEVISLSDPAWRPVASVGQGADQLAPDSLVDRDAN